MQISIKVSKKQGFAISMKLFRQKSTKIRKRHGIRSKYVILYMCYTDYSEQSYKSLASAQIVQFLYQDQLNVTVHRLALR